jgi:hypothetical protein
MFQTKVIDTSTPPIHLHGLDRSNFTLPARHYNEKSNVAIIHPKNISFSMARYNFETAFEAAWPLSHSQRYYYSTLAADWLLANSNPNKTFTGFFHVLSIIVLCFM